MKAAENQLLPFLEGKKQFIIPIYQRTYSWTREQCAQLWSDIVHAATDKEVDGHFVGSIVYIQRGLFQVATVPQLLVIDGQQRLTTLSLLLVALAQAAEKSSTPLNISAEEIYDSYLVNKHGKDEQRYKLLLTQSDKDMLIGLIDHPERVRTMGVTSLLAENYLFFEEQIRQNGISLDVLYTGICKLIIVEISLDKDHDNPQLIFESLNSTGMDLSQADLIRNYVLMGLDNEEQTKLYKDYWYPMEQGFHYAEGTDQFDRFMRDYLTVKQGTIPNIDRVYTSFKIYHRSLGGVPIHQIVEDIYRYAGHFVNMALLREGDREIRQVLRDINTLKVDVAYPFLLQVYDDYVNHRLSKTDLIVILKLVESYVFRRVICGVPTNTMNKTFATLAREINKQDYLESVQAAFLLKDSYRRFPRDDEFRAAFVVKDVYNFRNRNYLLRKLENYDQKELVNVESCTIEHILPQNEQLSDDWQRELGPNWKEIQARYLHTIGNLTLTGYNSKLGDRPFKEKRDMDGGFAHSPIRLSRSLAALEHWNKDEIETRAQKLANMTVNIWAIPPLSAEVLLMYLVFPQKDPQTVVIGPVDHLQAGFIPEGFKIVQLSEKKFHYFRLVNDEWVQYGNGKDAWYAISWDTVGRWTREFYKKQKMPLGVGGTVVNTKVDDLAGYSGLEDTNGYTLDNYPYLHGSMRDLFEQLRKRILNLDVSVREEYKKLYIAYKTATNFVDIEPQAKRLRLTLNMKFSEINDPKGMCRDISKLGHWSNGDVEVGIASLDQLDDVMDLVRQSFEKHWEEDEV